MSCLALTAGPGCAFGPKALEHTHSRYNDAVRLVYEEQFLRNVVQLRYHESILGLNVAAITAQYELTAGAELRPFFSTEAARVETPLGPYGVFSRFFPFASLAGSNRPTVSFDPADSSETIRQFLTPIPAETLAFLAQSNAPVSVIVRLWIDRLNGVPNVRPIGQAPDLAIADHSRFHRVVELLRSAQERELFSVYVEEKAAEVGGPLPADKVTAEAAVEAAKSGLEYRPRDDGKSWALVRKERRLVLEVNAGGLNGPEHKELAQLLNLQPGERRYDIVATGGGVPDPAVQPSKPSKTLRVVPRSTAQVFAFLANGVEVPADHFEKGLVNPVQDGADATGDVFKVHVCKAYRPPANAYVAVKHRGYWFYIDDRDQASKSTMALMLQLSRLNFGRPGRSAPPVLTLPAGR